MKVLTYRSQELITEAEKAEMLSLFGEQPYNQFIVHEMDMNYDTFIPELVELFATIQCDRRLNERETAIRERIAKGLTPSKSRYYKYVEHGLVMKLMADANRLFHKEFDRSFDFIKDGKKFGDTLDCLSRECEAIIRKAKAKLKPIPEPEKRYELKKVSGGHDQTDVFQCNDVYIMDDGKDFFGGGYNINEGYAKAMYNKFPFLCKLYYSSLFKQHTIQINVYDVHGSDKALQVIVNQIIKDGKINPKFIVNA